MKIKKGKATILALATAALIASLVYDKKTNKKEENKEYDDEDTNTFIIK
ncbi:hypothetical protein [uncultured Clostridium sp.]|nr:hypothetical protein [uncultured Clostridium sp.]